MFWANKFLDKGNSNAHNGSWEIYFSLAKKGPWTAKKRKMITVKIKDKRWCYVTQKEDFRECLCRSFLFWKLYIIGTGMMSSTRKSKISFFGNLCNVKIGERNLYHWKASKETNMMAKEKEFIILEEILENQEKR